MVVDDPKLADIGTSRLTNNSFISPGAKFSEYTSSPFASLRVGVPPQEGAVQSIDVVASFAFPRFSTTIHAVAVLPGMPYPSVMPNPVGPTIDNPLVRSTSIGSVAVLVTSLFESRVNVKPT